MIRLLKELAIVYELDINSQICLFYSGNNLLEIVTVFAGNTDLVILNLALHF
jgi:hypothetical protein